MPTIITTNALFKHFEINTLPWKSTAAAAGAYNLAEADLFMAPLVAYNMYKLSKRDEATLNQKIALVREQAVKENGYDLGMLRLQKNIRCKIDKSHQECK